MKNCVRRIRRRCTVRMILGDGRRRVVVVRRRWVLARKAVARADKRDHARDDGGKER